jgi:hypothetical protein
MPGLDAASPYLNQCKEDFGEAYVQAVAAVAGCWIQTFRRDFDGMDGQVTRYGDEGTIPDAPLRFQLKTTKNARLLGDEVRYALEVKNYDKLRIRRGAPAILILIVVPDDPEWWLEQDESALALARAGYWVSLEGAPATRNGTKKTIALPRTQLWSVEAVGNIMEHVVEDRFP